MEIYCKALPDITTLEDFHNNYEAYIDYLYQVFINEIKRGLHYDGKDISTRRHPEYLGREDAFYHLTHVTASDDRIPDLRRSERLRWIKPTLTAHKDSCGMDCLKIYFKGKRLHLLNADDRYLVVLEPRKEYTLLVTAFYIEQDHTLSKKIKDFERYKTSQEQQKTLP